MARALFCQTMWWFRWAGPFVKTWISVLHVEQVLELREWLTLFGRIPDSKHINFDPSWLSVFGDSSLSTGEEFCMLIFVLIKVESREPSLTKKERVRKDLSSERFVFFFSTYICIHPEVKIHKGLKCARLPIFSCFVVVSTRTRDFNHWQTN